MRAQVERLRKRGIKEESRFVTFVLQPPPTPPDLERLSFPEPHKYAAKTLLIFFTYKDK